MTEQGTGEPQSVFAVLQRLAVLRSCVAAQAWAEPRQGLENRKVTFDLKVRWCMETESAALLAALNDLDKALLNGCAPGELEATRQRCLAAIGRVEKAVRAKVN